MTLIIRWANFPGKYSEGSGSGDSIVITSGTRIIMEIWDNLDATWAEWGAIYILRSFEDWAGENAPKLEVINLLSGSRGYKFVSSSFYSRSWVRAGLEIVWLCSTSVAIEGGMTRIRLLGVTFVASMLNIQLSFICSLDSPKRDFLLSLQHVWSDQRRSLRTALLQFLIFRHLPHHHGEPTKTCISTKVKNLPVSDWWHFQVHPLRLWF